MQTTKSVFLSYPSGPSHAGFSSFIERIVQKAGFNVQHRTDLSGSPKITQKIIDNLRSASLVIADLSGNSPNVLYEVGFAQSLGKPVLLIAERGSSTPFDLSANRIVFYSAVDVGGMFAQRLENALQDITQQLNSGVPTSIDSEIAAANQRKSLFISYSHKDKSYLDRLMVHLQPLEADGYIDLWVDTRLRPGDKWKEDIEKALSRSSVVILLASADYLASEFIRNNELPHMLASAEQHGTRILPLVLKPCRFTRHETLRNFQSLNDPAYPIALLPEDEREVFYDQMANEIEKYY